MNPKPEEKTIKELFQSLKQEDERRVTSFDDSWAAAQSRLERREKASNPIARRSLVQFLRWVCWTLAPAATVLIVFGLIVFRAIRNEPQKINNARTAATPSPSVRRDEPVATDAARSDPIRGSQTSKPGRLKRPRPRAFIKPDVVTLITLETEDANDFILLRHGADHQPMENGEVIRVEMPRSALVALGLPLDVEHADEPVKADLLIGDDGLARAIRFVR